jgi:DNA (cytosine-5)-methyltransferase 1
VNYLSVCSGIEAATVAWHPLGWNPVGFSDIEKFPSEVLRHHYPSVTNFGDMTKYKEWNLGTVDLLVGGTPCQSFSVAGLRKGLEDPRGNLALVYCGILDHFRPKWFVWENVPGVLSSGGGRDFGSFLGAVAELGYGFAYRVLDAQYFGVAQRRRRVFVVGCLGDWRRAAEVLFEPDSLRRDNPPSREERKETTSVARSGVAYGGSDATCSDTVTSKWAKGSGGPAGNECGLFVAHTMAPVGVPEVMSTLLSSTAGISRPGNAATEHETYIPMAPIAFGVGEQPDLGHCLRSQASKADKHESTTYVAQPIPYRKSKRAQSSEDDETWVDGEVSNTINLFDQGDIRTTHAVVQPIALAENTIGRQPQNGGNGNGFTVGGPMYTLNATGVHGVAQPIAFSSNMSVPDCQTDVSPTLKLGGHGGGNPPAVAVDVYNQAVDGQTTATLTEACGGSNTSGPKVMQSMAVRRLTPVECERLQGFPDNYTNIPWRKSAESPDGPRYKALGNSMAVPVMAWIGRRIQEVEAR